MVLLKISYHSIPLLGFSSETVLSCPMSSKYKQLAVLQYIYYTFIQRGNTGHGAQQKCLFFTKLCLNKFLSQSYFRIRTEEKYSFVRIVLAKNIAKQQGGWVFLVFLAKQHATQSSFFNFGVGGSKKAIFSQSRHMCQNMPC